MNPQFHRLEVGGNGAPKEGVAETVDRLRVSVLSTAEANVDSAMMLPPYREVASLVLQEMSPVPAPTTPQVSPQGLKEDHGLAA